MTILIERVLEAVLFVLAVKAGLRLFGRPGESPAAMARRLSGHRLPAVAIVITAALAAGCLLELAWPGALAAMRQQPGGAWWRTLTAPFAQDGGGLAGALFNLVSAAIAVALAEWRWGHLAAAAVWLTGAWAPVGDLAALAGYHVSAANAGAYSAGSSGATYFTAAAVCAALLWSGSGAQRLQALAAPAVAGLMWLTVNDGHGVLFLAGFAAGLLLEAAWPLARTGPRPALAASRP